MILDSGWVAARASDLPFRSGIQLTTTHPPPSSAAAELPWMQADVPGTYAPYISLSLSIYLSIYIFNSVKSFLLILLVLSMLHK